MRRIVIFMLLIGVSLWAQVNVNAQETTETVTPTKTFTSLDETFTFEFPETWGLVQRVDGLVVVYQQNIYMEIYIPSLIGDRFNTPEDLLKEIMGQTASTLSGTEPLLISIGALNAAAIQYTTADFEGLYLTVEVAPQQIALIDIHVKIEQGTLNQAELDRMFGVIETFQMLEVTEATAETATPAPNLLDSSLVRPRTNPIDQAATAGTGGIIADATLITEASNASALLTQNFTNAEGTITLSYPEDWTTREGLGGQIIISSQQALEAGLVIIPPDNVAQSPLEALLRMPIATDERILTETPVQFELAEGQTIALYKWVSTTDEANRGIRAALLLSEGQIITADIIGLDLTIGPEFLPLNILSSIKISDTGGE